MAGFGIPSAWGRPTPGARPAARPPATSMIWGRPATRTNGLGGFTLATPKAGQGGLSGPQTAQTAPSQGVQPPSTSPGGSASPQQSSSSSSPSPLDSTYYNNLAANQFKVGNQINGLMAASQNDNTALKSALDQLAYQQPRDSLKLEQGANRSGGLFSSVYDQNLGNLQHSYATRQDAATSANAEKQAAIQSQIGALRGGEPIYDAEQYDAAIARAIKAAASNPATGQPPSGQAPTGQAPAGSPATAPASAPRAAVPASRPRGNLGRLEKVGAPFTRGGLTGPQIKALARKGK